MKRRNGFTLIELMIVVAIVGILAAVAYPAYQDSVLKSRRADGQSELLRIQSLMERYYYEEGSYTDELSDLDAFSADTIDSPEGHYKTSLITATTTCPKATCYVLQSVPQGSQSTDGNLTVSSTGVKTGNW